MGFVDQVAEGLDKVAKEAQKAFDQGKSKVEQLQVERQMDAAARKLGYLEFDRYRGRTLDETARQGLIEQMAACEDQIIAAQGAKAAGDEGAQTEPQAATPGDTPEEPTTPEAPA